MNAIEFGLASLSVSSSVAIVLIIVAVGEFYQDISNLSSFADANFRSTGWFLVWKIFLSRFKLVRELLGQINDNPDDNQPNRSKSNSSSASKGGKKLRKD
jgi:Domain of unknown function (DUF4750)